MPIVTHHRPYKPHKPELVVLCDVSGSVAGFAHFTLMLAYALTKHGDAAGAEHAIMAAEQTLRTILAPQHPNFALAALVRAEAQLAAGKNASAELAWHAARARLQSFAGDHMPQHLPVVF